MPTRDPIVVGASARGVEALRAFAGILGRGGPLPAVTASPSDSGCPDCDGTLVEAVYAADVLRQHLLPGTFTRQTEEEEAT